MWSLLIWFAVCTAWGQTLPLSCHDAVVEAADQAGDSIQASPARLERAIVELRRQIAAGCTEQGAAIVLARALSRSASQTGQEAPLDEARTILRRQTELFPGDAEGWSEYARVLAQLGGETNLRTVIAALRSGLSADSGRVDLRVQLGLSLFSSSREEALVELREAYDSALNPKDVQNAGRALIDGLREIGQTEEASALAGILDARYAIAHAADEAAYLIRQHCSTCRDARKDELDRGVQALRDALSRERAIDMYTQFALGEGFYELLAGSWMPPLNAAQQTAATEAATDFMARWVAARPLDPRGHLYTGFLLLRRGDSAAALAALRRAIELTSPGNLLSYGYRASEALRTAGMKAEADAIQQQALDLYGRSLVVR